MKQIKRTAFYSLIALSVVYFGGCSKVSITTADKAYEKREYIVSADLYKSAYNSMEDKAEKAVAAFGAAESYFRINDYANAQRWYANTLKQAPGNHDALFQLALVLKSEEKYEEAKETFKQYIGNSGDKEEASIQLEGCVKAMEWKKENSRYVVVNEKALNSQYSDFAALNVKNKEVYFTSDRESRDNTKTYARTGDKYLAIYRSEIKRGRDVGREEPLKIKGTEIPEGLEFPYNEGVCTFDQSTIFFTLCNEETSKTNSCKIYSAKMVGRDFQEVTPLSFCTDSVVNYGHPALSKDGQTLYFSADLSDSRGGKDIYFSRYDKKSRTWSEPENAGDRINTKKDEMYPFIHDDGTLYFSSSGHVGMGGLDVFYSIGSESNWQEPVNMKAPVNSGADDFSVTVNPDKETGFFSSNRSGGSGKDDIYSFYMKPLVFNLTVIVKDNKTQQPVADATIKFGINDDSSWVMKTNNKGELKIALAGKTGYTFFASKSEAYYLDSENEGVSTAGKESSEDFEKVLFLSPINVEDEFTLAGIYYDVDKADLRSESLPVLDSLITLLNKYPGIRIEIGSHTDCRSPKEYNEVLSQKRAQSAVDYLVTKGINAKRLEAKGYGESRLVNDCACEDGNATRKCTEEEHQLNRRTTFRILSK